jgi:two-component system phosphate regulon sensor histidine kinase PhoR
VLINLISNAIYYGKPDGTVTVEMVNNADKMYIKVMDNGLGIEAEHLPHLFDRFYRVEKSRSREKGGTGLGLAIVKNLLDAHDEEITVSSVVGQGTVFTFSLTKKIPTKND